MNNTEAIIENVFVLLEEEYDTSALIYDTEYDDAVKITYLDITDKTTGKHMQYAISPEQEAVDFIVSTIAYDFSLKYIGGNDDNNIVEEKIKESVDDNITSVDLDKQEERELPTIYEDYPTVLVALESEKDAELTYKTLIDIEKQSESPNEQVIELLEKILADELEHIALLSALSANKNSEFVAEDNKDDFDGFIDEIK